MKVLIVAKTRMQGGTCVGGLALEPQRNVRLLQANGTKQPHDTPYDVGQIWDLNFKPKHDVNPPHVEDVHVLDGQLSGQEANLGRFLKERVQPWRGAPSQTFECLVRPTYHGAGYVNDIMGVPNMSVGFWEPDQPLTHEADGPRLYYRYPARSGVRLMRYVGFVPPVEKLLAGTLVRLSLARWWRQEDSELEERCYLQMSGWYL